MLILAKMAMHWYQGDPTLTRIWRFQVMTLGLVVMASNLCHIFDDNFNSSTGKRTFPITCFLTVSYVFLTCFINYTPDKPPSKITEQFISCSKAVKTSSLNPELKLWSVDCLWNPFLDFRCSSAGPYSHSQIIMRPKIILFPTFRFA